MPPCPPSKSSALRNEFTTRAYKRSARINKGLCVCRYTLCARLLCGDNVRNRSFSARTNAANILKSVNGTPLWCQQEVA